MNPSTLLVLAMTLGQVPDKGQPGDIHLVFGNPSQAKHDAKNPDPENYLMVKPQFALSYNSKKGTPNWVSYRLVKADCGRAARPDAFFPDPDLPKSFFQVKPFDYHFNATGMSRGHMCPNTHRNATETNAKSTFVMTNMVPQTEELNAGAWNELEKECRGGAFDGQELFIICGPHGQGGTSDKGLIKTVANGKVVVPKSCWKVILIHDKPGKDPVGRVNKKTQLVGVIMPNDRTPEKKSWQDYLVPVAEVEKLTGYKFFDQAPAAIIEPLKKQKFKPSRVNWDGPIPKFSILPAIGLPRFCLLLHPAI